MNSAEIATLIPAILALITALTAWLRAEVANRATVKNANAITAHTTNPDKPDESEPLNAPPK